VEEVFEARLVANETEAAIPHQSLNRAVRHVSPSADGPLTALLGRIQVPFHGQQRFS
jgi:hypothetical protein